MAKAPAADSPEFLQEEVEKEIEVHKGLYIGLAVAILVGIIGYSIFNSQMQKSNNARLEVIQGFATGFDQLEEKKITTTQLFENYKKLDKEVLTDVSMYPYTLDLSQKLADELKIDEAIKVVEMGLVDTDKNLSWYLLNQHLASLYEDQGNFAKAISLYEGMLKTPFKFNEAKVYFELGRIYKEMGNTQKAKENLSTVVAQFPNEDITKFAKILLRDL